MALGFPGLGGGGSASDPTQSGPLTINIPGIATAQTAGLTLANTTASTSGATQQYSPASVLIGHAWNTTATAADNYVQALNQLQVTSSASPTGTLIWAFSTSATSTPSYVQALQLTAVGNLLAGGTMGAYNGSATAPAFYGASASQTGMYFPTSTSLGLTSNGTLALTLSSNQNATFAGTVQAAGYLSSDGTAGMTLASTAVLGKSITIKNGLIVAFA